MKIGIVIIATNAYFLLGLRFMRKFLHHYKGNADIEFHFFSDTDPEDFLPQHFPVIFYKTEHNSWVDGTNSKFTNILKTHKTCTYLYYFDADTNVDKDFTEEWFLGDLVGGEHYANRSWMIDKKGFDRNPKSTAYVPEGTPLPQMYYYGAFFGGKTDRMCDFCIKLLENQALDKAWGYEPAVNDESYINQYFHYNPPTKVVATEDFKFVISDKGGLGETRNTALDIVDHKMNILEHRYNLFDIVNNTIVFIN